MSYTVLPAGEAFWRPSNQMGVLNTDLGRQLGAETLGARFWRLRPGQASTKHRHYVTVELYVVLEGTGRIRVDDDLLELPRMSSLLRAARQRPAGVQRHRGGRAVAGLRHAQRGRPARWRCREETIAYMYPDGLKALPPELQS